MGRDWTRRATPRPCRDDWNAEARSTACASALSLSLFSLSLPLLRARSVAQLIAAIYATERRAAAPVRTERNAVRIAPWTFTILVNTRVT